jgi:hypothetical protein
VTSTQRAALSGSIASAVVVDGKSNIRRRTRRTDPRAGSFGGESVKPMGSIGRWSSATGSPVVTRDALTVLPTIATACVHLIDPAS